MDWAMIVLAIVLGAGSIALFVWSGQRTFVHLGLAPGQALAWNAGLSMLFFLQHSLLVRRPIRARLRRIVPERYDGACYAIASGIVLTLVALLLQPVGPPLVALQGLPRVAVHSAALLAAALFAWGVHALQGFDLLGLRPIKEHLGRRAARRDPIMGDARFVIRGPYRWVRHPLYLAAIILLWADPDMNRSRLLLAVLWSGWIVVGALLEERDLLAEFGDEYRAYRERVPFLLPWRRPVAEGCEPRRAA